MHCAAKVPEEVNRKCPASSGDKPDGYTGVMTPHFVGSGGPNVHGPPLFSAMLMAYISSADSG